MINIKAIIERLENCKAIPVISVDKEDQAVPLCNALLKGGIDVAEITFRTSHAEKAIKDVADNLKDVCVGAGTVISVDLAKKAIAAGAQFIVTPGFNTKVVEYCIQQNVPVIPGTANPTDIEMALDHGLNFVKFFPAEAFGGLKTLKAMSAPYSMMKFMPTGGINENNIMDYLNFDKVVACGGTFMIDKNDLANGEYDKIQAKTKEVVQFLNK